MWYGQLKGASHASLYLDLVECCPHDEGFCAVKTGFENLYSKWEPNGSLVFVWPFALDLDLRCS